MEKKAYWHFRENYLKTLLKVIFYFDFHLSMFPCILFVTLYSMKQLYLINEIKFCVKKCPIELFREALLIIKRNVMFLISSNENSEIIVLIVILGF